MSTDRQEIASPAGETETDATTDAGTCSNPGTSLRGIAIVSPSPNVSQMASLSAS
jgi:hypothetical protein